jgi:hypothetical protein
MSIKVSCYHDDEIYIFRIAGDDTICIRDNVLGFDGVDWNDYVKLLKTIEKVIPIKNAKIKINLHSEFYTIYNEMHRLEEEEEVEAEIISVEKEIFINTPVTIMAPVEKRNFTKDELQKIITKRFEILNKFEKIKTC